MIATKYILITAATLLAGSAATAGILFATRNSTSNTPTQATPDIQSPPTQQTPTATSPINIPSQPNNPPTEDTGLLQKQVTTPPRQEQQPNSRIADPNKKSVRNATPPASDTGAESVKEAKPPEPILPSDYNEILQKYDADIDPFAE